MTPAEIAAYDLIHAIATGLTLCLIAGLLVTLYATLSGIRRK